MIVLMLYILEVLSCAFAMPTFGGLLFAILPAELQCVASIGVSQRVVRVPGVENLFWQASFHYIGFVCLELRSLCPMFIAASLKALDELQRAWTECLRHFVTGLPRPAPRTKKM